MSQQAITFNIKGIKCDNENCDWCDMEADFIPEKWLNHPCPKCGANLFTQADHDAMQKMFKAAAVINAVVDLAESPLAEEVKTFAVDMDGSGEVKFTPSTEATK